MSVHVLHTRLKSFIYIDHSRSLWHWEVHGCCEGGNAVQCWCNPGVVNAWRPRLYVILLSGLSELCIPLRFTVDIQCPSFNTSQWTELNRKTFFSYFPPEPHTHTNHFPAFWAKKAPCVHAWEIIFTFIIHRLRTAAWCANMWVFVRVFTCVWRVFVIHSGRVSKVCLSVGSSGGLLCSTCQFSPLYRAPQAAKKVEPCRVWWPVSSPSRSQSTRWYSCTTMEIQSRDGLGWVAAAAPAVPPPLACLSTNSSAEKL